MGAGSEAAHREDEAVLEVRKLLVALLTAVHAVVLVHHLLVAVLGWAGLVETVLLAQVHYGGHTAEVISLHKTEGRGCQRGHAAQRMQAV